jgi:hypothetical protein
VTTPCKISAADLEDIGTAIEEATDVIIQMHGAAPEHAQDPSEALAVLHRLLVAKIHVTKAATGVSHD